MRTGIQFDQSQFCRTEADTVTQRVKMDAAQSSGAQGEGNSPANEREAVRSSILKFLDSPSHLVHKSLDETLADILSASAPPPNAAAQQPLPEPVSPEQRAVRHSLQTFLNSPKEKVFMTLEETAHALAFPEAAQPVLHAPTYDWEAGSWHTIHLCSQRDDIITPF